MPSALFVKTMIQLRSIGHPKKAQCRWYWYHMPQWRRPFRRWSVALRMISDEQMGELTSWAWMKRFDYGLHDCLRDIVTVQQDEAQIRMAHLDVVHSQYPSSEWCHSPQLGYHRL